VPSARDVRDMSVHVDHEMSRLLRIGETLRCWRGLLGLLRQDTILRALRVAYAGHARAVFEFFHDGRPRNVGIRRIHGGDVDVWLSDYTGASPGSHPWTPEHEQRSGDADKQLAHLSTGRLAPARAHLPEWGAREDRDRLRPIIQQVKADLSATGWWDWFPETARALEETKG